MAVAETIFSTVIAKIMIFQYVIILIFMKAVMLAALIQYLEVKVMI